MGSRTIAAVTVASLLAMAGLAAAQQPSFSVALAPQGEVGPLAPGQSDQVNVEVRLEGDSFTCAQNEELPVTIEVDDAGQVTGTADPSELVFSNTQGIHNSQTPAGGYNESGQTTVSVDVGAMATSGSNELTVTGTFPGGSYTLPDGSCASDFPSAEGTATIPVTVQADEPDDGGAGDGADDGEDGGDGEDEDGIPLGPFVAPLALIAAAFAFRRR